MDEVAVPARLREHAFARVEQDERAVGRRGARDEAQEALVLMRLEVRVNVALDQLAAHGLGTSPFLENRPLARGGETALSPQRTPPSPLASPKKGARGGNMVSPALKS